ncbi:hypothetical protein C5E02_10735 [Rathayibacter rathayi]|uniref:Alcohol dehydrogenase iron-type/glycerol dehydrogenase GldA domain-containing protein n=2 Tax=Rathayibacter rathayi TaxID=33887 RepID=A0ABD6W6V0_RATRA|nr:iron-containing alcohol dehydrogenase [Rathayibacter rathayi]AZZ49650.1 hypothetical protein C1O28_11030 [Rathayibacter rathayi]MWV75766.1 iron-containing alcohol dehydrogenase [Rathayibacter rathayi NCPPB 2980 = VKM Ac-1601]PPF11010.1 hypothetical protein C5C04_12610 [Rathayibacter rathayi]PPF44596.1 hypothetical protein C5C08_13110 [Rathayibacter rathayi]PPF77305.1 hypothetical protein C5C14_12665 [Rathayibacter rathayi]
MMSTLDMSWCPTSLYVGRNVAGRVVASLVRDRTTMVITDAFNEHGAARLLAGGKNNTVIVEGPTLDSLERAHHAIGQQSPGAIVAVGGGTVMDSAKLASALVASGRPFAQFSRMLEGRGEHATRRGLRRSGSLVVAVPTTVGTASEVSPIACVTTGGGHHLVSGDDLRPDFAVIDSANFDSLPSRKVRDGAFEVFMRIAAVGTSSGASPMVRRRAADLGVRLAQACVELVRDEAPAARLEIALIGAESKTSFTGYSSDPHAIQHWYLANELAYAGAFSKVSATAALAPTVWRLLEEGNRRLGDDFAMVEFLAAVRRALPLGSAQASEWVSDFARYLSITLPAVTGDVADRAVDGCLRGWGGPNMALSEWDARSIRAVYEGAISTRSLNA